MSLLHPRRRNAILLGLPLLLLAACGGGGGSSSSPSPSGVTVSTQANISGEVPSSLKGNPLQIATDATYAPNEFVNPDSGQIEGWDIDLGNAICKAMGEACTFNNVTFDDIIAQLKAATPSEQAGGDKPRYQFSISSWTPTAKREQSGIDFITYYQAGEAWFVKSGSGVSVNSAADMCGKKVAVEAGTTEESDAWGYMGKQVGGTPISGDTDHCTSAGKSDITVESYQKQTDANQALISGRADIGWADSPVAAYQVKQSGGQLQLAGSPCSVTPYGIAVVKGSPLEQAITDAVKYLITSGAYQSILQQWGVTDGAITAQAVSLNNNNPSGSSCVPSY
ncbi:MAG TPA: ABC transporter substrate-binding protein [Dehalococcoidia bacterium]|nr:ABC transporter substrate-binding protein [Dehalococcoidia bacterium]